MKLIDFFKSSIMKLDIKSILILILLLSTLIFGYKWFFTGDPASKERVKQLEIQNKELDQQNKLSDIKIGKLQNSFDSSVSVGIKLNKDVIQLEEKANKAEIEANITKFNLANIRKELNDTRKNIENLRNTQNTKTEGDLLQSIKNKTK